MAEHLDLQEVALLIKARQLLKAKGLDKAADIKSICEAAGISRKTGYQWARKLEINDGDADLKDELARLKAEHEDLKKRYDQVDFENEGRKLAWKIHGVDEFLAAKKNTIPRPKKKSR
ncbi:MAG: hypothetical protein ABIG67_01820 [Pseudomonadota bacterium]